MAVAVAQQKNVCAANAHSRLFFLPGTASFGGLQTLYFRLRDLPMRNSATRINDVKIRRIGKINLERGNRILFTLSSAGVSFSRFFYIYFSDFLEYASLALLLLLLLLELSIAIRLHSQHCTTALQLAILQGMEWLYWRDTAVRVRRRK